MQSLPADGTESFAISCVGCFTLILAWTSGGCSGVSPVQWVVSAMRHAPAALCAPCGAPFMWVLPPPVPVASQHSFLPSAAVTGKPFVLSSLSSLPRRVGTCVHPLATE